jgi:protoporphyrinogen/coproporphyrinogen III oxidase
LEAFMARRFGGGAGRSLAWLAASGVFAGDPARLSASAAFPALTGLEREAGSIVKGAVARRRSRQEGAPRPTAHIPSGGMAGLADHMSDWLGDRYRSESPITHLRPTARGWRVSDDIEANHVVLACGVEAAAAIIGGDAGALLLNAERAPVVVVGLGGRWSPETVPPGFGALVTRRSELVSLGVLFESSYAPDRAPAGHSLVKVIAGGATRPYVAQWDEDRIVEVVGGEVCRVLGVDIEAGFVEVVRHRIGIPQYLPGHAAWLRDVEGHLPAGIHLAGWNYRGVGIAHLATDAVRITRTIMGRT